jgi:hypothetical protein
MSEGMENQDKSDRFMNKLTHNGWAEEALVKPQYNPQLNRRSVEALNTEKMNYIQIITCTKIN